MKSYDALKQVKDPCKEFGFKAGMLKGGLTEGGTGLVITHDVDIAQRCDRIYKVKGDKIVEVK